MNSLYRQARFLCSAHALRDLPPDQGQEVAFAGRSNAGKSSALNAITDQRSLARISKTPGRTQLINVFPCSDTIALVDLPGYGYAKVPAKLRGHWEQTLPAYLAEREALRGLILIMDCRHPMQAFDESMLAWSQAAGLPVHILLTKADKLSRGKAQQTLLAVRRQLDEHFPGVSVQLFSAQTRQGVAEAHAVLDRLFGLAPVD